MTLYEKYNDIFQKEIIEKSNGIIFSYFPLEDQYYYFPYSHAISEKAVEDLGKLMRLDLYFYAFSEEEVVNSYEKNQFASLEQAAKYAYRQRLPKRADINDGLPSEVLLDLLVQIYNPKAYKLAVRTIFRQNDNNEIKGYDLTYFTKDEQGTSLWLGQAKLGNKDYCKSGIDSDLCEKYEALYLTHQVFFVCDKRFSLTDEAKAILKSIDGINILMMDENDETRARKLIDFFREQKIKIKIPCLLAYENDRVYKNSEKLKDLINLEVESIKAYFNKKNYKFSGFAPEIVFYVFPIESLVRLRDKEMGFYAGLC